MRSIRRSLILSVTVLFVGGLLVVAIALDRIASDNLEARAKVTAQSIENEYQERCREERDKLDQQLLHEARTLVSQMQSLYAVRFEQERQKFWHSFKIAEGAASSDRNPFIRLGFEAANTNRGWPFFTAARAYFSNFHLDDTFGQGDIDGEASHDPHPRYFQINVASRGDSVWRSRSLGEDSFPPAPAGFDPDKLIDWKTDTLTLKGESVRRVVFRSPILLPWFRPIPSPRPSNRREGGPSTHPPPAGGQPLPPMPPPGAPPAPPTPAQIVTGLPRVLVHCARPESAIDPQLAAHRQTRDAQLAELAEQIHADRVRLRVTVVAIGAVATVLNVLGGMWLVGRGLIPLRRLSDAVSRVSEKDFRLPLDGPVSTRELVPIHARLTETLDQLRRAFEREKQAVADISHELRTPVAALLTTLDVALRKSRSAEQYRQTLEDCRGITRQLGQLVERVMTLAYIDAGQTRVTNVRVAAGELAAGCASVIRPLAAARGLSFTMKADSAVELETDRDKLREVLMNLLHNAVEYNNPGGSVELDVHPGPAGRVAFDVRDTGIGMTADVRGRIFERFYRADPSRTETGVHAGLGLAIVKEYVDRLGGTITVESEQGKGSLFRVELPAAKDEAESPRLAS